MRPMIGLSVDLGLAGTGVEIMGITGFIFLAIVIVVITYFVMLYNNLVTLKHNVSQA